MSTARLARALGTLDESAKAAVTAAHHEAYRYASAALGSVHLLLGLLVDTEQPVTSVLIRTGATPDMIRRHFEQVSGARSHQPPRAAHLPYTPHAKAILINAADCTNDCGVTHTGANDLWRAIADAASSPAARMLAELAQLGHVHRALTEVAHSRGARPTLTPGTGLATARCMRH
ncbi:Clp protease N-terminal domain-containing protein [Mycolicibacterium chlorophenolicum]